MPKDGYELFKKACDYHESINISSDVQSEIVDFIKNGSDLSANAMDAIQEEDKVWSLLEQANSADIWNMPDRKKYSTSKFWPHTSHWLTLGNIATAKAIKLYLNEEPEKTIKFISELNDIGLRTSKAADVVAALAYLVVRQRQHPVLISSIDMLPAKSISNHFSKAKRQYCKIPEIGEIIIGLEYVGQNSIQDMFQTMREGELKGIEKKFIQDLKGDGVETDIISKIEDGELLSFENWEEMAISTLNNLYAFYTNRLTTASSKELLELDSQIEERISNIESEDFGGEAIDEWMSFATNATANTFSLAGARKVHRKVGKAICHDMMQVFVPSISQFGITYREFVAAERMILIRYATRIYRQKHNKLPENLTQLVDAGLLDNEMTIDPLTKESLLVENENFKVYSAGKNLIDDGGEFDGSEPKDLAMLTLDEYWENNTGKSMGSKKRVRGEL